MSISNIQTQKPLQEQISRQGKGAYRQVELEILRALKILNHATAHKIADYLGYKTHRWVAQKLKLLKNAKRIYISDWQKVHLTGPHREVYSLRLDEEEDEPRPKPQAAYEKVKNYRKRKKLKELIYNERN